MTGPGPLEHDEPDEHVVHVSYTSSPEILDREATAFLEEFRSRPGFWTEFWKARARRFVLHLVAVAVVWFAFPSWRVLVGVGLLALGSFALWTSVAARRALRLMWEELRAHVETGCAPGTVVSASYSPTVFEFVTPLATTRLDPTTLVARVRPGFVFLDQEGRPAQWLVPDELIGADGHGMLRTVLGERYVTA